MTRGDGLQARFGRQLSACPAPRRWLIGFSGGLDSRVLVELAAARLDPARLLLLHIHHHLQPEADRWAEHAWAVARSLGLELKVIDVHPASASEAAARDARYAAFAREMGRDDVLLLGHHADDQAETLLLRLVRGAGPRGLRGMPRRRPLGAGQLLRPLLDSTRAELEAWARQRELDWVEDPSNAHCGYDRNFLRHRIMAPLARRWPGFQARMAQSAALLDETDSLLAELAAGDLAAARGVQGGVSGSAMAALSPARRRNLLRHWIESVDGTLVNQALLVRIETEVLAAAADRQPALKCGGHWLRRYRGDLYLVPEEALTPAAELAVIALEAGDIRLRQGRLCIEPGSGDAVAIRSLDGLALRYRRDGERCRPAGRRGEHVLKKLFQEQGVPPWRRDGWPLLVRDDRIVAVPGLWVCEGWQVTPGERGYRLVWDPIG